MNTLPPCAVAALLSGQAPACVHAADAAARVRPDPPGTVSVSTPVSDAAVDETYQSGADGGIVRRRAVKGEAPQRVAPADLPKSSIVTGLDGQSMRTFPGSVPDFTAAARPAYLPPGAVAVHVGEAVVLRMPGNADGLDTPKSDGRLPPACASSTRRPAHSERRACPSR